MTMDLMTAYRAGMFDGKADIAWLSQGWRGLRQYGRKAKAAIEAGDLITKGAMIGRADQLLNVMTGILDSEPGSRLGAALMTIYTALRFNLLRANIENSIAALDDFEAALAILDRDMIKSSESAIAA
jgi:flagellar biosynthetic protein FliS